MTFTTPRRLHWLLLISAAVIFFDRLTKDVGLRPHPIGRGRLRHSAFSAHHALAQRGCGLLALRRLCLAEYGSLGSDLIFGNGGARSARCHDPPWQPVHRDDCSVGARIRRCAWATCTTASSMDQSLTLSKYISSAITGPTSTWPTVPSSPVPACSFSILCCRKRTRPPSQTFPLDHFAVLVALTSAPHAVTGSHPFVTSYPSQSFDWLKIDEDEPRDVYAPSAAKSASGARTGSMD